MGSGGRAPGGDGDENPAGLLVVGIVLFVAWAAWTSGPEHLCPVFALGALAFMAVVAVVTLLARRRRERVEARIEWEERRVQPIVAYGPPSLVTFTLAVPSTLRSELGALAAEGTPYKRLSDLADALARADAPIRAALTVTPPAGSGSPIEVATSALEALVRRDVVPDGVGYRGGARTLSTEASGTAVLALALVVRGPGEVPPLDDRGALRAAVDAVLPIEPERVLHVEVRWVPVEESHALDDATLARLFPELRAL